ncbi:MAG TPA: diguanylate cyclase [Casimicrobiaceae bacterium]|nr:diguanylate cyclase [Casimicrobiaceae bacterium]
MAAAPVALRDSIAPLSQAPYVAQLVLVAGAYFVAAKLSLFFAIPPGYATAVWPPSGIAVAAMLLLGTRIWPGIWVGVALVNAMVDASVFAAALIACGNTLEAIVGASLIRRQVGGLYEFDSGEDVVRFVAIAASCSLVAATIGVGAITLHAPVAPLELAQNWWTWWEGDTVGIIMVTPLIMSWCARESRAPSRRRTIEAIAFGLVLLLATALIFGGSGDSFTVLSLVFMIPPAVIWAAFRLGQRQVTLASAAACSIAIWYTVQGRGPFALASLNQTLLLLLAFVCTVVTTGLVLSAVVGQRSRVTEALQGALRELAEQAIRDPMTGLHNRRFLREFLARELIRAKRARTGLAVIMMDLDHFKRVNDSFGHDAGDLVLTDVSTLLKSSIRGSDMVCRFGGEEFVLVLTDATLASAQRRCEEIRAAIKGLAPTYRGNSLGHPTASFGIALFPDHAADADSLINASDAALYDAKRAGRDCIVTNAAAARPPSV